MGVVMVAMDLDPSFFSSEIILDAMGYNMTG